MSVSTENQDAYELLVDEIFFNQFAAVDVVDNELEYIAQLNGDVITPDDNNIMLIHAGRQIIEWMAVDDTGNISAPLEQVVDVYPQVGFEIGQSIIGEASITQIKVRLTGDSPLYPVAVNLRVNELSEVDQNDFDETFEINEIYQVTIEAGESTILNREVFLEISIFDDKTIENNERLILELINTKINGETSELLLVDEAFSQHVLTITDFNLAPTVQLKLEQNGVEVANITQGDGSVTITAHIQDGNGMDTHTLTWDLNDLGLNAPFGDALNFNPDNIPAGSYSISVEAVDNGIGNLTDSASIEFDIVEAVEKGGREGESSVGGSLSHWFLIVMLACLLSGAHQTRRKELLTIK